LDFTGFIIQLIISTIILAPVLWISGRLLVGKEKAKFTDAIWIVILGIILHFIIGELPLPKVSWLATIIVIIVWLLLIKHFFDTGWIKAIIIAILAIIILLIIIAILGLLGFAVARSLFGFVVLLALT